MFEHGNERQRQLWLSRLEDAPRYEPNLMLNPCPAPDPWPDDGMGLVGDELRCALLACLHIEAARYLKVIGDPVSSEDHIADTSNDYANVTGLIDWVGKWD